MEPSVPNRRSNPHRRRDRKCKGQKLIWQGDDYVAWIYVMTSEDHPGMVKVGLSSNPIRRAFDIRMQGKALPVIEYGRRVWGALQIERRAHDFLAAYHFHGEWFKCSVPEAAGAICSAICSVADNQRIESKAQDVWLEEQAQAVAVLWKHDWYIPKVMRERVECLREESKRLAREKETRQKQTINAILVALAVVVVLTFLFVPMGVLISEAWLVLRFVLSLLVLVALFFIGKRR